MEDLGKHFFLPSCLPGILEEALCISCTESD